MEPVFGLWEETDTEHSKLPIGVNLSVNVLDCLCVMDQWLALGVPYLLSMHAGLRLYSLHDLEWE